MPKKPTSEWGLRALAAGLDQKTLAQMADVAPSSVGRGLRGEFASGVPGYLRALIVAWELMAPEQRADWVARLEADEHRRFHEKARCDHGPWASYGEGGTSSTSTASPDAVALPLRRNCDDRRL